jgi:membrane fusion protein (multidrug efflux system)
VAARPVKADRAQGNAWIVSEGLKAGDQVIVEGFQKVQPGATVKPVAWKAPAAGKGGQAQPAAAQPEQKSAAK